MHSFIYRWQGYILGFTIPTFYRPLPELPAPQLSEEEVQEPVAVEDRDLLQQEQVVEVRSELACACVSLRVCTNCLTSLEIATTQQHPRTFQKALSSQSERFLDSWHSSPCSFPRIQHTHPVCNSGVCGVHSATQVLLLMMLLLLFFENPFSFSLYRQPHCKCRRSRRNSSSSAWPPWLGLEGVAAVLLFSLLFLQEFG